MNNLEFVKPETRKFVEEILHDDGVHYFTKDIIREGLFKDSLGAVYDVQLALKALEKVLNDIIGRG